MTTEQAAVAASGEKVTMTDGRVVEFNGKRKLLKDTIVTTEQVGVRFDFRNGETRTYIISPDLMDQMAAHGAAQKIGDETAGVTDVDDMVIGVDEIIARLEKGEWSARKEGGGFSGASVLMKALVEYSGKTAEEVKTYLSGLSQAEKTALRASKQLKPIVDRLEADKVTKGKVNTDDLLAGLA